VCLLFTVRQIVFPVFVANSVLICEYKVIVLYDMYCRVFNCYFV